MFVTGTANVCLQNLRKTLRYGGRKNVPSVEEVTAVSAGRNSKRQLYRLPGGSETVINTKSTTVMIRCISSIHQTYVRLVKYCLRVSGRPKIPSQQVCKLQYV